MTAHILDGKHVAEHIQQTLHQRVIERHEAGLRAPSLAVILVGGDPASMIYVNNKRKTCQKIGMTSHAYDLPASTTEAYLLDLIHRLNHDASIDGILVQLPLPPQINMHHIIDAIDPKKDVDGFHPYNLGCLAQKRPVLRPCTPYGIMQLLAFYHLDVKGLHAVVVGASNIVGRPMSLELSIAGATVTTCNRSTTSLEKYVTDADLLVVATGIPDLVHPEWIKQGAIVVDVGIHRLENRQLRGDLDFSAAAQKAAWITPVPFGVGPMTVTTLLSNTLHCAELSQ